MVRVLIALLLLSGCGPNVPYITRSPLLRDLVEEYRNAIESRGISTSKFGRVLSVTYSMDMLRDEIGLCQMHGPLIDNYGYITQVTVRPDLSDTVRRYVVFHEMTHCVFIMKHNDIGFQIMNTYAPPESYIEAKWDSLVVSLLDSIEAHERDDPK